MSQGVVALGGLALVGANFWTGEQRQAVDGLLWKGTTGGSATSAIVQLAGELVFVIILYVLAGQSDSADKMAMAILAAIAVLFLIHRSTQKTTSATTTAAPFTVQL